MNSRRDFLRNLGVGAAIVVVPSIVLPEKRIWQVHPNTPVNGVVRVPEFGLFTAQPLIDAMERWTPSEEDYREMEAMLAGHHHVGYAS